MSNSVDTDLTSSSAPSGLGLHLLLRLPVPIFRVVTVIHETVTLEELIFYNITINVDPE